jgi:branched-chain amino acid transport system permease protein
MSATFLFEQVLNGVQFGLMLFLLAAGLTLVFGIMNMINLAHGSLYMIGAYLAATGLALTGSFVAAVGIALAGTAAFGALLEAGLLRRFYRRDHLSQVLATFALILILNDAVRMIWGPHAMILGIPEAVSGPVELLPGFSYPAFRLVVLAVGLLVALGLYLLVVHTRMGMQIRAGASNREMANALGGNIAALFTTVFALGAALCALAGAMLGPLLAVQVGMGESIIILAFVVVVIGGIGSVRGALVGALVVGCVDTFGRAFLPTILREITSPILADNLGPSLASMLIYIVMAAILFWKPRGLFPAHG